MVAKDGQNTKGSPKVEVGEIDTRAPFQSVKDAVDLFGEGAFSVEKPAIRKAKPHSAERVLAKETQLHLDQKELNKLKEQLKNAENTKAQALVELETAKRTADNLMQKLRTVSESKESVLEATDTAKNQANQLKEARCGNHKGTDVTWKQDLETAREHYTAAISDLDAAKQELRKICLDCEASIEAKAAAIKQAAEAEHAGRANMERAVELSKEIAAAQESIGEVKLANMQVQQELAKMHAQKDAQKQSYKATLEESAKKLLAKKKLCDPALSKNLETQLAEKMAEIGALQKEMENARASDLDFVRAITCELDDAKESLHKVAEEESSLQSTVESLKLELENVKKEHSALKEKETETESIVGNLHVKLRKTKSEFEAALADENKVRGASEEMISTFQQLSIESENARREAEEMKQLAEELKNEAEATRGVLEDAEKKLTVALEETEIAKADESRAFDQIKILSERTNAARASISESGAQITISREEFESSSRKVEESQKLAEMRVAAAMARVEAVKASENEALKRLEVSQKEIDNMKAATQEALKRAEMAEAAKRAVEGELMRWHEREQKKEAEAASRILAETKIPLESSPDNHRIPKQKSLEKVVAVQKLEKSKTSVSKILLLHNLSVILRRTKKKVEGGSTSHLPGEKPP